MRTASSVRPASSADSSRLYTASALVVSSRYEGFGNVLVEALASGIPVISFDCEFGPKEILGDGNFGVLIPPEDIPKLSKGIDELISNSDLRSVLSRQGIDRAAKYSQAAIFSLWDGLLRQTIASGNQINLD